MTNQEMFDRAVRGLSKQDWKKSLSEEMNGEKFCAYDNGCGLRCAWGHVDPSIGMESDRIVVEGLRTMGRGVAATLTDDQLAFAENMQLAHDLSSQGESMCDRFFDLGRKYNLKWPQDVPRKDV